MFVLVLISNKVLIRGHSYAMLSTESNSNMAAKSQNGRHLRINRLLPYWTNTSNIGTKLCFSVKANINHIMKPVILIFLS